MDYKSLPDSYWQENLTDEQYRVLRKKSTEMPYSGVLTSNKEPGKYKCAGCGAVLFESDTKFDSRCGWPAFFDAVDSSKIKKKHDFKLVVPRTEVLCANCGGHLGHVFDVGYTPTGKWYCINSAALKFEGKESGVVMGDGSESAEKNVDVDASVDTSGEGDTNKESDLDFDPEKVSIASISGIVNNNNVEKIQSLI